MKKLIIVLLFASCSKSGGMSDAAKNADTLRKHYAVLANQIAHDRDWDAYASIMDSVAKYDSIFFALTGQPNGARYEDFNGNPQ